MSRPADPSSRRLAAILQSVGGGSDQDRDEANAAHLQREKNAYAKLRRASLYGGGARTVLPKTKKIKKKTVNSPFAFPGSTSDMPPPRPLSSSAAPGAHDLQYQLVPCKSELMAINTSSVQDGVRHVDHPPWYLGYQNSSKPPDNNLLVSAGRYGYRGSASIQQYETEAYELPSKTRTQRTPKFLTADDDYVDEYVTPVIAARVDSVNGHETPKLWSASTTYVTGSKLKPKEDPFVNTHQKSLPRQSSPNSVNRIASDRGLLLDYAKMESQNTIQSRTSLAVKKFETQWYDTVLKEGTGTIRSTLHRTSSAPKMHRPGTRHSQQGLIDASDSMRYSGSTAYIIHTQSADELKFRLRMESSAARANAPYAAKWSHVNGHFRNISLKLRRGQSVSEAVARIGEFFAGIAIKSGSTTCLRRADFVRACSRSVYFEDVASKQISQLYAVFDPMRHDSIRFVDILLSLLVLDRPDIPCIEKLRVMFNCSQLFGQDREIIDRVTDILTVCASSIREAEIIDELVQRDFRSACIALAVSTPDHSQVENSLAISVPVSARSNPGSARRPLSSPHHPAPVVPYVDPFINDVMSKSQHSFSAQEHPDIYESFLNANTFVEVVRRCPDLLRAVDAQMTARLVACHGKDDRAHKNESANDHPTVTSPTAKPDFKWIMKSNNQEPRKRDVFDLFS